MDFFDSSYYRINKLLLSIVGLWPFQRTATKRFTLAFGLFGCASFSIPQVLYIVKFLSDIDKLISSMPTVFAAILITVKILTLMRNSAEFKALLNHIYDDWQSVRANPEERILREYAAAGRKFTVYYSSLLSIPVTFYLLWPIVIPILDFISPLNESRTRILPHAAEFLVDEEKHYYAILMAEYVAYLALIPITVGSDIMYVVSTEHVCGMFAVLSYRLENCLPKISERLRDPEFNRDEYFHDHLIGCIRLHVKTIIFVDLIISIFTTLLLVDITLGLIMHCAACVMIVVRMNQPSQVVLFGAVAFTQSVRLFFNCRPGEKLIDHSSGVAKAVYNVTWYDTSAKAKKLLMFMMMRSQIACTFVIAKLYVVNLNSFGVVMKTSLSYCTVMASVHKASYIAED